MIVAIALIGAIGVAAVVVARMQRADEVEFALARGLQPGTPLTDVTAHLRRLGVAFTIDSTAEGTIVKYRRKTSGDGRVTSTSEQQILFDAQDRLRDMRTVDQIMIP